MHATIRPPRRSATVRAVALIGSMLAVVLASQFVVRAAAPAAPAAHRNRSSPILANRPLVCSIRADDRRCRHRRRWRAGGRDQR